MNKRDSGLFETVTCKPKGIFLKRVAALSVHLFLLDSVFFPSWRNNTPLEFFIFYCVGRCPNSCFHYYFFLSIRYTYQSRQLSWISCDLKSVCYSRFFNFVIYYNYEKFGFYKAIQFWCEKCIIKTVAFLPITFLQQNCFLKFVYTCDKLCPLKVLLIN